MITIRLAAEQSFYVTGGTLRRDAPSYVERQADQALYDGLLEGKFCYVLTSRQMGKSSLMVRTAARLREDGAGVAVLDLTAVGQNLTAEQWYDGLLGRIGQQLHLEDELEEFWLGHSRLGPLQRWMRAITEVVLPCRPGRLVIFVDEIDVVRSLVDFSTDEFFAGIREFYNRRTEEPELERLSFCLLGVATPSNLISDTRTTPFNIGQRVELNDFTETEAMPLARGLGHDEKTSSKLLNRVLHWTGGHPYLTQRLCQAVAKDGTVKDADGVDRICAKLFLTPRARERDDNLLFVRERMLHSVDDPAALLDLYNKIRNHKRVKDDEANPLVSVLRLSGVTRMNDGQLHVRNRIYSRVFDQEWVQSNMPGAELRRQRAAYRHGRWRAAAMAAIIVAAVSSLTIWAFIKLDEAKKQKEQIEKQKLDLEEQKRELEKQKQKADEEKKKAEQSADKARLEEKRADEQSRIASEKATEAEKERDQSEEEKQKNRRLSYASDMKVASQAWETNDIARMHGLLDRHLKPGPDDLRGFEWYYLWRLRTRDLKFTLSHEAPILSVIVLPDSSTSASVSADGDVKLLDITTGRQKKQFTLEKDISLAAISPDGEWLASRASDNNVKLWNVATGQAQLTIEGDGLKVSSLVFSPDGKMLASVTSGKTVNLWGLTAGRNRRLINQQHSIQGEHVAFSPDSKKLASVDEHTVKLYDGATGRLLHKLNMLTKQNSSIAFSPDGKMLALGSNDYAVRLLDIATGQELCLLNGHADRVSSMTFSPDGKKLATGSVDRTIKLWDVATGQELLTLKGHVKDISSVAFSPNGKILVSGSADNSVMLWDVTLTQQSFLLRANEERQKVVSVAFSPDGKTIASGGFDGAVKLWDVATGQMIRQFKEHEFVIFSVAFSSDGKMLASGSSEGHIHLRDVTSNQEPRKLKVASPLVISVAFSPDGKTLASGDYSGNVTMWDVATGNELNILKGHSKPVRSIAFSPDGKRLASGSWDRTVKLWDLATGRDPLLLEGHKGPVLSLAFSPKGEKLVSGSADRTLKLWDVVTRQELFTLTGHIHDVASVAFSPDGKRIASGGIDRSVKLWDVSTEQELLTLKGHSDRILSVTFSPDGEILASGGYGGIALWRAGTEEPAHKRH
jgi:WD40 repeat protein